MKQPLKISQIDVNQAVNHITGEYNLAEWVRKVEMFKKHGATFYANENKVFAKYNAEGINFFSEVTIHSVLSNTGFSRVDFDAYMENGMLESENYKHLVDTGSFVIAPDKVTNTFNVSFAGFWCDGKEFRIPNTEEGRKIMIEKSKFGVVFSQM